MTSGRLGSFQLALKNSERSPNFRNPFRARGRPSILFLLWIKSSEKVTLNYRSFHGSRASSKLFTFLILPGHDERNSKLKGGKKKKGSRGVIDYTKVDRGVLSPEPWRASLHPRWNSCLLTVANRDASIFRIAAILWLCSVPDRYTDLRCGLHQAAQSYPVLECWLQRGRFHAERAILVHRRDSLLLHTALALGSEIVREINLLGNRVSLEILYNRVIVFEGKNFQTF